MNTLYINEDSIRFIGFSDISNQAFLSFRNSGLVISPNEMPIHNTQLPYSLKEHTVTDHYLASRLSSLGFQNVHSFVKDKNGYYFCAYPDKEEKK